MKHIVIIGNGVAGITASRFIRMHSDYRITVVSAESDFFYARTALMYVYMGHLTLADTKPYEDWFWDKNRIKLVRGYVDSVNVDERSVSVEGKGSIEYDFLIIATGSKSNKFGWPGQDLSGVQGLYSIQDLDEMEWNTQSAKHAVVVGGGLIGIEMAEMLHSRNIATTFLVREENYMDYLLPLEEAWMINNEICRHGIDLRLGTELKEIRGSKNGTVKSVITAQGDEIDCDFVGLTVGVSPSIGFLSGSAIETNRGVLVDDYFRTNIDNVFSVGDCAEFRNPECGHKTIEQLWYTGRKHGKTVARTICGEETRYDKGVFFNSAKYFTLEYQTYGNIAAKPLEGTSSFVWQSESSDRLIRIDYESGSRRVLGFNLLGVRFRHDVCEEWILGRRTVDDVLADLRRVNFDPEFFRKFDTDVTRHFANRIAGGIS